MLRGMPFNAKLSMPATSLSALQTRWRSQLYGYAQCFRLSVRLYGLRCGTARRKQCSGGDS